MWQNVSMIKHFSVSINQAFHTSANLHFLAEISQLMHLTILAKLQMLMVTCQTQCEIVLKKL